MVVLTSLQWDSRNIILLLFCYICVDIENVPRSRFRCFYRKVNMQHTNHAQPFRLGSRMSLDGAARLAIAQNYWR